MTTPTTPAPTVAKSLPEHSLRPGEILTLRMILKRAFRQGPLHLGALQEVYRQVRSVWADEFTEDNVFTTDDVLREHFENTQHAAAISAHEAEVGRLRAELDKKDRLCADRISLARGAAKHAAWQDFACRFTYSQRQHIANLLGHEWTINAIEIQSKYGTANGAVPTRIDGTVSNEKALANVAALTQGETN
jgi:hypothetical protein